MYALTLQYTKYIYHSAKEKENINNYFILCFLSFFFGLLCFGFFKFEIESLYYLNTNYGLCEK
jgi:hypothetical protein